MILQRFVGDAEFLGCDEIGFFVNVLVPGHKSALASLKVKTPSSVTQKSAFAKSNRSKNVIKQIITLMCVDESKRENHRIPKHG